MYSSSASDSATTTSSKIAIFRGRSLSMRERKGLELRIMGFSCGSRHHNQILRIEG